MKFPQKKSQEIIEDVPQESHHSKRLKIAGANEGISLEEI